MEKISIVIPVYGQWDLVKRNVDALLMFDQPFIEEIILVNDCSPDPNPFSFDNEIVRIVDNIQNLGYAGTANHGLRVAKSDIIVLMDSDSCAKDPFISKVIGLFKSDQSLGCVSFSTVDEDGNITGCYQKDPSVLGYILGQQLEEKYDRLFLRRGIIALPFACGIAFRKACLDEVGMFDATTFPVLDCDLDLSRRIINSRWKLSLSTEIKIIHCGGYSCKVNNKRVSKYHEGRWKFLMKNKKIKHPKLIKSLVLTRIVLEIFVMQLLILLNIDKDSYQEKIVGRKNLFKSVNYYAY